MLTIRKREIDRLRKRLKEGVSGANYGSLKKFAKLPQVVLSQTLKKCNLDFGRNEQTANVDDVETKETDSDGNAISKISEYEEVGCLGHGGFGTVVKAFKIQKTRENDPQDQKNEGSENEIKFVAIKKTDISESSRREASLLSKLMHPYIVHMIDFFLDSSSKKFYQVLEFCKFGDLAHVMIKLSRSLSIFEVQAVTRQLVSALCYLHGTSSFVNNTNEFQKDFVVVHRDIKGLNILLNSTFDVKLGDFGSAVILNANDINSGTRKFLTNLVTDLWMAPELFLDGCEVSAATDIWAMGITLLELLNGKPPFAELNGSLAWGRISSLSQDSQESQLNQLGVNDIPKRCPYGGSCFKRSSCEYCSLTKFLSRCLNTNPNNRPTSTQLKNYSFVQGNTSDIDQTIDKTKLFCELQCNISETSIPLKSKNSWV